MRRAWQQCVSLVRFNERLDYQIDYDGRDNVSITSRTRPRLRRAFDYETGVVTSTIDGHTTRTPYTFALRNFSTAALPPDDAPVVLGPSAALTLAEEWLASGGAAETSRLQIRESLVSPYPPHALPGASDEEVPVGTLDEHARLEALLVQPASWSRPLAALDADRFASLRVGCRTPASMPKNALLVDSMIPLTSNPAAIAALVDAVVAAAGEKQVGVVRDPIAGDHYGLAAPLLTSLRARDLTEWR